jgi:hypothetical protein
MTKLAFVPVERKAMTSVLDAGRASTRYTGVLVEAGAAPPAERLRNRIR